MKEAMRKKYAEFTEEAKKKYAETKKEWRKQRKAKGICMMCPADALPGKTLCATHMDEVKQRDERLRAERKSQGLCIGCGKNPPSEKSHGTRPTAYCAECRSRIAKKQYGKKKELYKEAKLLGKCVSCGGEPLPGKARCGPCLEKRNKNQAALQEARISEGVCVRCGKHPFSQGSANCLQCLLKLTSIQHFGNQKHWRELGQLYMTQKGLCPYLGDKIPVGVSASIDHIIATNCGGANTLSNMEWTHNIVNMMKSDTPKAVFLSVIKNIYENLGLQDYTPVPLPIDLGWNKQKKRRSKQIADLTPARK